MTVVPQRRRGVLAGGGPAPAVFPLTIPWHTAFYADDITGLVDGDPVAQWNDSTGNARHATQGTSAKRPVYRSAVVGLNGQPAVDFDGVDDWLATAKWTALNQPNTLVIINAPDSTVDQYFVDGTSTVNRHLIGYEGGAGARFAFAGASIVGGAGGGDMLGHLLVGTFNGASTTVEMDGTQIQSGDAGAQGSDSLRLGANQAASARWFNGKHAFVALFDGTLTAQQKSDLHAWAQSKYGTP